MKHRIISIMALSFVICHLSFTPAGAQGVIKRAGIGNKTQATKKPAAKKNSQATAKPAANRKTATPTKSVTQRTTAITSKPTAPTVTGEASKYPFRKVGQCPMTDLLNPMDGGVILGWTTVEEAVRSGGVNKPRDDNEHVVSFSGRDYWDHEGDGIITSLCFVKSDGVPPSWENQGISFSMSYNEWMSWLRNHGFSFAIAEKPSSKGSFSAKLEATDRQHQLVMDLDFNYGEGSTTSAKNTLYSIRLERPRIHTRTTDYSPFFPIEGVTPGVTTLDNLRQMGMTMESFGDNNEYKYGEVGGMRFYNDKNGGNIVCSVDISNNMLPYSWVKNGDSRLMSYNKWMKLFREHNFIIMKNEPKDNPTATYPDIKAVQPYLGISIKLSFRRSFSIKTEGDSPEVFWNYSIGII